MDLVASTLFNTNNHHDWAPFVVDGATVTVDPEFWDRLTEPARHEIDTVAEVEIAPVTCPHPPQTCRLFWAVYRAHNRQYDHEMWHQHVGGWMAGRGDLVTMVVVDGRDLEWLLGRATRGRGDDVPPALAKQIQTALTAHYPAFVKTGQSSGKNAQPVQCRTVDDVVDRLTRAPDHARYYQRCLDAGRSATLVFQPWREIKDEYRVIVAGGAVRGVSQQPRHRSSARTQEDLARVGELVLAVWAELTRLLPFADVVLDLWIDDQSVVHLIKCHPGGRWASTASSLFHWVDDDVENLARPALRYLI